MEHFRHSVYNVYFWYLLYSFTLSWETTLTKYIFLPFEKGSSLKEKNLLPLGANSFLLEKTPFQKGLSCSEANRKSKIVSPLAEVVSSLL